MEEIWKHAKDNFNRRRDVLCTFYYCLQIYTLFYCNTSGGLFLQLLHYVSGGIFILFVPSQRTTLNGKWSRIVTIMPPCCRRISPKDDAYTYSCVVSWHGYTTIITQQQKKRKQHGRRRTKAGIIFIVCVLPLNLVVSLNFPFSFFVYYAFLFLH